MKKTQNLQVKEKQHEIKRISSLFENHLLAMLQ